MIRVWLMLLLGLLLAPAIPAAEIYKCVGKDGRVSYSGAPCPRGSDGKTIIDTPRPAAEWRCVGRERMTLKPLNRPGLPDKQAEALQRLIERDQAEGLRGEVYLAPDGVLHRCYPADPTAESRVAADGSMRLKRGDAIEEVPYVVNRLGLLQRCTRALLACRDDPELPRPVSGCFNRVGYCQTETPEREDGVCCPRACAERFRGYQLSGMNDSEAFFATFHGNDRCIDTGEPILP
ncbi:MAG: DUF4124 domain-containing protein [Xanthomonadales bacterium]|jgi:hypothetical protein|nr:DUF4124 domain-containing protein [Xanthomonadales bacterium]